MLLLGSALRSGKSFVVLVSKVLCSCSIVARDLRFGFLGFGFKILGFRFWVLLLGSPLRCGKSLVFLVAM